MGISHIHALGILANIQGESSFRIGADESGNGSAGIGLFQYTYPSRKRRFLQAVPDWRNNWKAQIDYAIKNDENTPLYLKKQFSSPEEAADNWMIQWENPDKAVYGQRRRTHNAFIKSFRSPTKEKNNQPSNTIISSPKPQASPPPTPSIPVNPKVGDRLGAGRNHGGVDLQVAMGTPLKAISDGVIVDSDYQSGWGNFLVMKDNLGIYHLYGHMQSGYKRGGPVKKGEVIGKVGMTGRTTGPHLHWEAGTGWDKYQLSGRFDALTKYSKFAPFNTQASKETPAQISAQPKSSQPSTITPERKGSQMLFIDATQPQAPQTSYPSQQQPSVTPTISEFKLLNNFIKNKLLLDLAYL
jgi:murein DD-endopeptidase MepM/ murein hydrolase activator NlpD